MKVEFSHYFKKKAKKLPIAVRRKFEERIVLFMEDPYNSILHNHALAGQWNGYRSMNVTGDYRAIFQLLPEDICYFIDIGTHSYLYG